VLSARDPRALRLLAPSDAAAELGLGQCALSFRHAAARETLFPSGALPALPEDELPAALQARQPAPERPAPPRPVWRACSCAGSLCGAQQRSLAPRALAPLTPRRAPQAKLQAELGRPVLHTTPPGGAHCFSAGAVQVHDALLVHALASLHMTNML